MHSWKQRWFCIFNLLVPCPCSTNLPQLQTKEYGRSQSLVGCGKFHCIVGQRVLCLSSRSTNLHKVDGSVHADTRIYYYRSILVVLFQTTVDNSGCCVVGLGEYHLYPACLSRFKSEYGVDCDCTLVC